MKRLLSLLSLIAVLAGPCFASRTLTDEMGRKVVVPDHPHRVICLMPTVTDTVFALGARRRCGGHQRLHEVSRCRVEEAERWRSDQSIDRDDPLATS